MKGFEEYLITKGYKTNDIGEYSSLTLIQKTYKKVGCKNIVLGLNVVGYPPTLISPIPLLVKKDGVAHTMNNEEISRFINGNYYKKMLIQINDGYIIVNK